MSVEPELACGDLTTWQVDAVVNAANSSLLGGGGVDGAIHRAGGPEILAECRELRRTRLPDGLPCGQAVATTAGRMPARWVVHTVGPVHGRTPDGAARLRDCYSSGLRVAAEIGARSVAFPLISAGAYGWPLEDAVTTALEAIRASDADVDRVVLVLFDESTHQLARRLSLADR